MNWKIAFLGTYHPAEGTFRELSRRGYISILVLPKNAGFKNDNLINIAKQYSIPWTYNITDIESYDINLVTAANYPKIVPSEYLKHWPCINTHWSALPKYRGMHSTAWALINEDYSPAVTVHWMEDEFDTGDILAQKNVYVPPEMTIYQLHEKLAELQTEAVIEVLERYEKDGIWNAIPQDHSKATYVPRRKPVDGIIDWSWPTERIWNLVRVLQRPVYPGAFTYLNGRKLIIWGSRPADCPPYFSTVGQVVRVLANGAVWVKTGDTCLEITEAQWEDEENITSPDNLTGIHGGIILGVRQQVVVPELMKKIFELENEVFKLKKYIENK